MTDEDEPLFENDVTEEEFDRMWANGRPVVIVHGVDPAAVTAPPGWEVRGPADTR